MRSLFVQKFVDGLFDNLRLRDSFSCAFLFEGLRDVFCNICCDGGVCFFVIARFYLGRRFSLSFCRFHNIASLHLGLHSTERRSHLPRLLCVWQYSIRCKTQLPTGRTKTRTKNFYQTLVKLLLPCYNNIATPSKGEGRKPLSHPHDITDTGGFQYSGVNVETFEFL